MRNYQNEYEWKKKKYTEIRANIEKDLGNKLKEKLKEEKRTIAGWIMENARKYINAE